MTPTSAASVRPRRPEDMADCVRVLTAVANADGYPALWPDDPVGWLSPSGWTAAWVAEVDGVLVGHVCILDGVDDPVAAGHAGVASDRLVKVSRLFVDPSARGRKLGESLLGAAAEYAAAQGTRLILEVVDDGGPAIALYERLGWQQIDRRTAEWTTSPGVHPWVRIYLAPSPDSSEGFDYIASLPRKRMGAGVLFTDAVGRVLLVEPTYKPEWEIPGGVVEAGESPYTAARREVEEELGLLITPGRLLVVDWVPPVDGQRTEAVMFVFDGGVLSSVGTGGIRLPPGELRSWAWCARGEAELRLVDRLARRVQAARQAQRTDTMLYLENGHVVGG